MSQNSEIGEVKGAGRRALGKGLAALISDVGSSFTSLEDAESAGQSMQFVPVGSISPNPDQPRRHMDGEGIDELSKSIKEYGVLQPILVKKIGDQHYQIIAGERRYHAAKAAGLLTVPVLLKDSDTVRAFEMAIIENIQRQDLSPLEEAEGYRRLLEEHGYTQDDLAGKIGKSRSYIANMIRLLRLPTTVQNLLKQDKISVGHARALVNANDPEGMAAIVVERKLSVRELEGMISTANTSLPLEESKFAPKERELRAKPRAKAGAMVLDDEFAAMAASATEQLGLPVTIAIENGSYKLCVDCQNLENLDRVLSVLSSGVPVI